MRRAGADIRAPHSLGSAARTRASLLHSSGMRRAKKEKKRKGIGKTEL